MFVAGIDENGLGPKLGPLVITSALFELGSRYDREAFFKALSPRGGGAAKIDDSKAVMKFGGMRSGETAVLAMATAIGGQMPHRAGEFFDLVLDPAERDRLGRCPSGARGMCFDLQAPLPAFGADPVEIESLAGFYRKVFENSGIALRRVSATQLCPSDFNAAFDGKPELTKADLDLRAFEGRIRALMADASADALYLCGKVMGLMRYSPRMSLVDEYPLLRLSERKDLSTYVLQDLGEVRFVLDGDALHAPISVASMFGKYLRELAMAALNRFFETLLPDHEPASGYSDPATKKLICKALPLLEKKGIPPHCFLRNR